MIGWECHVNIVEFILDRIIISNIFLLKLEDNIVVLFLCLNYLYVLYILVMLLFTPISHRLTWYVLSSLKHATSTGVK
jgi:hypothetical protein